MFVHISPEADAIGETLSTLKFAERVASVELGTARVNKESGEIKELKEQVFVNTFTNNIQLSELRMSAVMFCYSLFFLSNFRSLVLKRLWQGKKEKLNTFQVQCQALIFIH